MIYCLPEKELVVSVATKIVGKKKDTRTLVEDHILSLLDKQVWRCYNFHKSD